MAFVIVREPNRVSFAVPLGDGCLVGRGADAAVRVQDPQVSRSHARLERRGAAFAVLDLQSRHGTFVNGVRTVESALGDQDRIQVGNTFLVFHEGEPNESMVESVPAGATQAGAAGAGRLLFLEELGRALAGGAGAAQLLERIVRGLSADGGFLGLSDRRGLRRIAHGRSDVVLGRSVLDALLERRESVRTSEGGMFAVGAPLLLPGRVLGLVYVMRWSPAAPFDGDDRVFLCLAGHLVATALAQAQREGTLARAAEAARGPVPAPALLGDSEPMRALRDRIERFAAADAAILIRGESGSGKELVARALHARSRRADGPFVAVNCAAIPESLIESELFGHDRGAFTGAGKAVRGKFALADGGTLFLDEVGDLGAAAQAKVLRAIEEGEVTPIGSEETLEVDVRVVSATHKVLEDEIAAGRFRADLYYRLAVAEIAVPPLGARGDDVLILAEAFLARAARRLGREVRGFTPDALATLARQAWPGNVRQLANEIERALLLEDGDWIGLDDLRARTAAGEEGPPKSLGEHERQLVQRALADAGGNVRAAAKALEISRNTLYRKLKKYGISQE